MKKKTLAFGIGGAIGLGLAWKFLTRANTVNFHDFTDKIHHAENSHFVEIDGMTVHFQEFGDRAHPTLFLIHGYTASTYVWHTVAPMLAAANFHVVAADLIGFGYSEKPRSFDYSIASHARVLTRLMDRLGIGRAAVVGSSYGGAVALTIALDYPERVERLVLVDAVSNDEVLNHPLLRLAAIPGVGELLAPFLVDSKALLKYRMQNTLAPENHFLITEDRLDSVHRPQSAADAHHSFLATARAWDACRVLDDAKCIAQPTLLIWGEKDTVIPIRDGEMLFDAIPDSRLVVLKNCGHIPQEERPEIFVDLVTEFCGDKKIETGREEISTNI
jgi:pimeloyl-ACP methyl ester carboxylesterase